MKKLSLSIIITFVLAALCPLASASISNSQNYRISVTIPPFILVEENAHADYQIQQLAQDTNNQISFQEVARNNKTILLKTIVSK